MFLSANSPAASSIGSRRMGGCVRGSISLIVLLLVTFLVCVTMILMFWISTQATSTLSASAEPSSKNGRTSVRPTIEELWLSESSGTQSEPAQ